MLIGNLALLEQFGVADTVGADRVAHELATQGRTPMIVAVDDQVLGVIAVADEIRRDAAAMVAALHKAGVKKVVMLTGDVKPVADAVAAATGIDEVHAGLLPEDKLDIVARLQRAGMSWPWSATASTTPRRWPPPTSAWPWARPARPWQ